LEKENNVVWQMALPKRRRVLACFYYSNCHPNVFYLLFWLDDILTEMKVGNYSPEFTSEEKKRLFLTRYLWIGLVCVIIILAFNPLFNNYVENMNCYDYGAFSGAHVVFYGLLVAPPILFGLLLLGYSVVRGQKVRALGQDPLPGEKLLKSRRFTYGAKAMIRYKAIFLVGVAVLIFSVPAKQQADVFIDMARESEVSCNN
jgi:hypothetical protein